MFVTFLLCDQKNFFFPRSSLENSIRVDDFWQTVGIGRGGGRFEEWRF